jgi:ATP-dependent HslUV protease ATP-binding subunit HslU
MENIPLTPRQIVEELDKHIIGQAEAKKAVAIALRTRILRKKVSSELRDEIIPKNILMIGPTGVGKTEIARRLARLINAPFIKVEATKYTEIGYVGKDVESIIRDLVDYAIKECREENRDEVEEEATLEARVRIAKELKEENDTEFGYQKIMEDLESGILDETEIEIEVEVSNSPLSSFEFPFQGGTASASIVPIGDVIGKMINPPKKLKKMKISEAMEVLKEEILEDLIDNEAIVKEALKRTEEDGIVFIDEIDKIAFSSNAKGGEVSREGVQRDLLPLIEGTSVQTKYGNVKTDHILFIGSGAFYSSKPSDLSPELQGRFPIRVELKALTREDMIAILTKPKAALEKQYVALMGAENINLIFQEEAIESIAEIAIRLNTEIENIGARRLYTILEKVLHDILFEAPERKGETITITKDFIEERIKEISKKIDLARFIL